MEILNKLLALGTLVQIAYSLEDAKYWMNLGQKCVRDSLEVEKNENVGKNGIIFVGDGMGVATITAGRIFKGQLQGQSGEEGYLNFEKFPNVGMLKTYNVDRQVPDSAATATALFSGVKTNFLMVGLDAGAQFNVCRSDVQAQSKVSSIIDWAIAAGKSTGIVTTTRVTHATPAAAFGHSASRDWECDTKIPESERNNGCKDLARQLVEDEPGRNINVILGGGEQVFRPNMNQSSTCIRGDGQDLVWNWMQHQRAQGRQYSYVKNTEQLLDESLVSKTDYLLGLFAPSHIPYDQERKEGPYGQPSLEEMTSQAIKILSKNPNGFVLIVEGGRIDHAHHDNMAKIALEEVVAFEKAVEASLNLTNDEETLILVTADHSHSMAMNGYPKRGNPIEGLANDETPDGFSYQTLSYTTGPGYDYHRMNSNFPGTSSNLHTKNTWRDLNALGTNVTSRTLVHHAGIWGEIDTHGGEDVPVYATGPMAHLFHGVHEQTHVAFGVAYALCIGPFAEDCRRSKEIKSGKENTSNDIHHPRQGKKSTKSQAAYISSPKLVLTLVLFTSGLMY